MKAHNGADVDSGLARAAHGAADKENDVAETNSLRRGEESAVFANASCERAGKQPDAEGKVNWHMAMRIGKRKALDTGSLADQYIEKAERLKANVRAKVEHLIRVIKRQFGHVKVLYFGLAQNTAQLKTLTVLVQPVASTQKAVGTVFTSSAENNVGGLRCVKRGQ